MTALIIIGIVSALVTLIFTGLIIVDVIFEKKEDAIKAERERFAKQVKAWAENPHDASLRWW